MSAITPPTGTATVVLGDVAGSTALWQTHPDAMSEASRRLATLIDDLVAEHTGHRPREQGEGDNFVAVFAAATDAAAFALALDAALADESWPDDVAIGMRIGLHTGDVEWHEHTGYLGPTFNRCGRLRDLGHARMVLLSQATRDIVADTLPEGATVHDLGSHQLRDLSRAEHVFQLRQPGDHTDFSPLKSVSALPNNLPVPVTSLVGRQREISEIARLLLDNRLVTLTGAGGAGKTRLAQHVASEVLQFAGDGAWWVDLMPVVDDERVPVAIAEAAGVPDVPTGAVGQTILAGALRDKLLLLVIDNCEHVIDAVADTVEELLHGCPNLRVLATSRENLDLPGEHAVRVRPLEVPEQDQPSLADLSESAATRLFLDRADVVDPEALHAADRRAVARICRRLDGMPLAIELAAARTRLLSIHQIETGLDDRFALLTAGRRGRRSGARQRTLEASIAWSYDLLEEDEKAVLCRLAVFPGPFDLDGARDVGAAGNGVLALDVLTALVDKSLVTVRPAADGRRYRLLESIRHYCLDRLGERGEAEAARHAHLDHTIGKVAALVPQDANWDGMSGRVLVLDPALQDDIRAADDWATDAGRVADLLRLHVPVYLTHANRGTFHEPLASLLKLLDHPELDQRDNALAHMAVTTFLGVGNRLDEAIALEARAVELGRAVADETGSEAALLGSLGALCVAKAYAGIDGTDTARQALTIARRNQSRTGKAAVANTAVWAGVALELAGHEHEAFEVHQEGIEAAAESRYTFQEALTRNYATASALRLGMPLDRIVGMLEDARASIPVDAPRLQAVLACAPGVYTWILGGDARKAQEWVDHGFAHAGPPGTGTHALMTLARGSAAWGARDLDEAIRATTAAAAMFTTTSNRFFHALCLVNLADAKVLRGDADAAAAIAAARQALPDGVFHMMRSYVETIESQYLVAEAPHEAWACSERALAIIQRYGCQSMAEWILTIASQTLAACGRHAEAATVQGTAERVRAERGVAVRRPEVDQEVRTVCSEVLGDEAFEAALAAGRVRSLDELLDWLLG